MLIRCLALLFALCPLLAFARTNQPNIVVILADDLGWADTTLYGHTAFYQTPNLERLAQRGMTFSRAYSASPLCSPTRSALLTGLSPARTGITTPNCHLPQVVLQATAGRTAPAHQHATQPVTVTRLKTDYPSLPKTLKAASYATGHFGKWHLGPEPYSPLEHGFDVDVPHHSGPGPAGSFVAPWKFAKFQANAPGEHLEDRMAAEAVAWMEQNRDRPFFLNYWQFSVHAPFDAKKALIEKHRARVNPNDAQRSPTYAAMIESLDDAIGTLLDALDRLQLADDTVILFTSDNGGNMYNEVDATTPTSNRPLRGGKATMFEGGTRVPCVVVWPGITPPGSRSESLVQSEDFYPTLLAGLGLPSAPGQRFDGTSLLPALHGKPLDDKVVFQYFPHAPGVPDWLPPSVSVHRDDGWKLIRLFHAGDKGAHRYLLYDLHRDLGETTNLASQEPALLAELDALIEAFLTRTEAVRPQPNPAFDPAQYDPDREGKPVPKASKVNGKTKAPPAVGPWQPSAQARLRLDQGALVITSTGGDPHLATRDFPAETRGPFTVSLRVSSTGAGEGRIYYGETPGQPFHKDRSLPLPLTHDGKFHEVTVTLPIQQLTALRFDPGSAPGTIVLQDLSVRDASGADLTPPLPSPNAP